MTQEDKDLLLKDLSGRLPYETWVQYEGKEWLVTGYGHGRVSLLSSIFSSVSDHCPLVEDVKPYLRPMSSMTEEEEDYYYTHILRESGVGASTKSIDWLNAHHFDYRRLVEKGLAIEASDGMYKTR